MFLFRHDKATLELNRNQNTGVTGQSLPPKNDFEHARGLRNSAYAVNLTYEAYRHTYIHTYIHVYTRKMVPITGRASASFSSMLELKRIRNE